MRFLVAFPWILAELVPLCAHRFRLFPAADDAPAGRGAMERQHPVEAGRQGFRGRHGNDMTEVLTAWESLAVPVDSHTGSGCAQQLGGHGNDMTGVGDRRRRDASLTS